MRQAPRPAAAYLNTAELDAVSRLGHQPGARAGLRLGVIAAELLDGSLGEDERALVTDVVLRLLATAQADLRQLVSERVARNPHAPHELVLFLAHDEIDIARPVLLWSDVLVEIDFVEILKTRSPFHAREIASRATLSEIVGDALVATGDAEAIAMLLQNHGAHISPAAAFRSALLARTVASLQTPLLQRLRISPKMANDIVRYASAESRKQIRSGLERASTAATIQTAGETSQPRQSGLVYANGSWTVE